MYWRSPFLSTASVVLAAFCWGLAGGIGALLMTRGWDPFVVAFYRGAIGLLCILIWQAVRPQPGGLKDRRVWFWSAIAGLGVAGNFALYNVSIAEGSVAVAATLMYCAPVFVYLVSFALKLEHPSPRKWLAIVGVLCGIILLTRVYQADADDITLTGIIAGLLAGVSYAVFIFGFKYAAPYASPHTILALAFSVLVLTLVWLGDPVQLPTALTAPEWPLFVTLGVVGAGISFVLYIAGLHTTAPAVAAVVAMVEPVTASLFGFLVLQQQLTISQLAGMAIILLTVTALSASSAAQRKLTRSS
ncbi:DMT family transporter [Spirochaeta africana]|uniref:Putative permease, DMT superfamily n=1 Tax=Spirochaeta africana (strain ATCC 700263 / DSM 8902 / Z-7692) TaxID=889378 RepID=H9UIY2_SPIAZ|nr:EamA family transporter [Spirochaeta africana]AFG37475.1 putative permease, DMT superfamily [Spirochaeta africana DSM 8902]